MKLSWVRHAWYPTNILCSNQHVLIIFSMLAQVHPCCWSFLKKCIFSISQFWQTTSKVKNRFIFFYFNPSKLKYSLKLHHQIIATSTSKLKTSKPFLELQPQQQEDTHCNPRMRGWGIVFCNYSNLHGLKS